MKLYHQLLWNNRNIEHIARHEVTQNEVEQVIFSHRLHIRKGRGQNIYYAFGQTDSGRYLFIVLLDLGGNTARVITARDMSDKEKRWYRQ